MILDSVELLSTEAFWCLKFESVWINCCACCRGQLVRKPEYYFSRTSPTSVEETQPTSFLYLFRFECKWLFIFSGTFSSVLLFSLLSACHCDWLLLIYNHRQEYDSVQLFSTEAFWHLNLCDWLACGLCSRRLSVCHYRSDLFCLTEIWCEPCCWFP